MTTKRMTAKVKFIGPARYRLQSAAVVFRALAYVGLRRRLKGPRLPGWNFPVELNTEILRRQMAAAFHKGDPKQTRLYLDSLVLITPQLNKVSVTPVEQEKLRGSWYVPNQVEPAVTMLYLHGGGYALYPKNYANLIAQLTLEAKSRTFALDYRLSPEHKYPAQLEDALSAYRWMLESGVDPSNLIVAGDSAGGNLTLALLLSLRDLNVPPPALAITLSPATDFSDHDPGSLTGSGADWIDQRMAVEWACWFCDAAHRRDPLVSPVFADLRGLPPIYIQAGRAEILYDDICKFAERARAQAADVVLESWDDMTHDFQMFGYDAPQSAEALRRFGEIIATRMQRSNSISTL